MAFVRMAAVDTRKLMMAACVLVGELVFVFTGLAFPPLFVGSPELFAHGLFIAVPLAVGGLLLGLCHGSVLGVVCGALLWLHASLLPADYYESYFALPVASLGFAVMASLVAALILPRGTGLRRLSGEDAPPSVAALVLRSVASSYAYALVTCLVCQFALDVAMGFPLGMLVTRLLGDAAPPALLVQVVATGTAVALAVVPAVLFERRRRLHLLSHSLLSVFSRWLSLVLVITFGLVMSVSYTVETVRARAEALSDADSHIAYFKSQLAAHDGRDDANATLAALAEGYRMGTTGVVMVGRGGTIVASNDAEALGVPVSYFLGDDVDAATLGTLVDATLIDFYDTETMEEYLGRMSVDGDDVIVVMQAASEIFMSRTSVMAWNALLYLVLFVAVYVLARLLLKNVVVRGFDETNATLGLITGGKLDETVNVRDADEFVRLSAGINATVGALRESLAAESARIARDLATAKAIQESALPRTFPPFPAIDAFDIFASMNAAREVGGDFYDFFLIDDHTLGFLIADVSGKGIPASLFMMAAKTELGNYMSSGMDLAEAVATANWHLCAGNDAGMFVTVWAATLNYATGELTYVNAGHNPPLLRHGGTWEWLRTRGGLFLGTFETAQYKSASLTLGPGDELLLYTDGVNEAFDADDEQFGDGRLEAYLVEHAHEHPRALVSGLRDALAAWSSGAEQSDDITMLALEFGTAPEVRGTLTVDATLSELQAVLGLVHGELDARLCPLKARNQIDIALEELFVNVCHYAYGEQTGSCTVDYVYQANPHTMVVTLTDWGVPFDPLAASDPTRPSDIGEATIGGLGIMMAKRSVDDLSYLRDGDKNVVAFVKHW